MQTTELKRGSYPDRITEFLTPEDLDGLRDMHYLLSKQGYGLADGVEHLTSAVVQGENVEHSVPIEGTPKKLIVKPEFKLENLIENSDLKYFEDHPSYNPSSVGSDKEKQRIDTYLFRRRKEHFDEGKKREEILKFEISLRNEEIRHHRNCLTNETSDPKSSLYRRSGYYGDEDGVFLTIASALWLKQQSGYYYERANEHYLDMGSSFRWADNLEKALVFETKNGDIKRYPLVYDELLRNEGFSAQEPAISQVKDDNELANTSIAYRKKEDYLRKNGKETDTGIIVLPSTM